MEFLPFYYPTTVIMIDDNREFLDGLGVLLPERLIRKCFDSPKRALNFLRQAKVNPIEQDLLEKIDDQGYSGQHTDKIAGYNFHCVERQICFANRFDNVSVVVVDYEMGEDELDGIEFCQAITETAVGKKVKKILLTGVAKEDLAVKAFNAGLIDKFLLKRHKNLPEELGKTIIELQTEYFQEQSSLLKMLIGLDSRRYLNNDVFLTLFQKLREQYFIVEYYFVDEPDGFIMLNYQGAMIRLAVMHKEDLLEYVDVLTVLGAPEFAVDAVRALKCIPFFGYKPDETDPEIQHPEYYLYEAKTLTGLDNIYYTIIENPPADIDYDPSIACLKSYLHSCQTHLENGK